MSISPAAAMLRPRVILKNEKAKIPRKSSQYNDETITHKTTLKQNYQKITNKQRQCITYNHGLKPNSIKQIKLLKSQCLQETNISRMNIKISMFKFNLILTRPAPISNHRWNHYLIRQLPEQNILTNKLQNK